MHTCTIFFVSTSYICHRDQRTHTHTRTHTCYTVQPTLTEDGLRLACMWRCHRHTRSLGQRSNTQAAWERHTHQSSHPHPPDMSLKGEEWTSAKPHSLTFPRLGSHHATNFPVVQNPRPPHQLPRRRRRTSNNKCSCARLPAVHDACTAAAQTTDTQLRHNSCPVLQLGVTAAVVTNRRRQVGMLRCSPVVTAHHTNNSTARSWHTRPL